MNLTVVILTYNEQVNLPHCLESLRGLAANCVVVDSGSHDRTLEIAREFGAAVLCHPFETHARQWQWAVNNLPKKPEWVLALDADQRVSPELRNEIAELLGQEKQALHNDDARETISGYYVKRRQIFRGKWIRHGGYYPKYLLKLFRPEKARIDPHELMDHHFYVEGPLAKLQFDIIEENRKENDISFWVEKHNRYATLIAREELHRREAHLPVLIPPSLLGSPDQRSLWLKGIWLRLPHYARPFLYFLYRYFFRLGFLDGKEGFVFHFLQGCWFRLLVDIKIDETRRGAGDQRSDERSFMISAQKPSGNGD